MVAAGCDWRSTLSVGGEPVFLELSQPSYYAEHSSMMAAPFLAFVLGMGLAWSGSSRWAMTMFLVALGLSIGVFVSHVDTPLDLQF